MADDYGGNYMNGFTQEEIERESLREEAKRIATNDPSLSLWEVSLKLKLKFPNASKRLRQTIASVAVRQANKSRSKNS